MIKSIVKDVFFLGQKSEPATKQDVSVGHQMDRGYYSVITKDKQNSNGKQQPEQKHKL